MSEDSSKTYEELRQDAINVLLEIVPRSLKHIRQEISLVVLWWYIEGCFYDVLPNIAFSLTSERGKLKTYWQPHSGIEVKATDDEVKRCEAYLHEAGRRHDWDAHRDLYRVVATQLTKTRAIWASDKPKLSEDFVMYVQEGNNDSDDLFESLQESVNEEQIDKWIEAGYFK